MHADQFTPGGTKKSQGDYASISIDLDNEWAYLKALGDPRWRMYPSYLYKVVPVILQFLKSRGVVLTVFVVGKDADFPGNMESLASLSDLNHEIGNHSLRHDITLHNYNEIELERDLSEAEELIGAATGKHPVGFRGPGFSLSEVTLRVLSNRGYLYDASSLPTYIAPLASAYHRRMSHRSHSEREAVNELSGAWIDGLRPLKPHRWKVGERSLLEIPVTTFPIFRFPIHLTYVMYAAGASRRLALLYFESALALCRRNRIAPSILLHPIDFIDLGDAPSLLGLPTIGLKNSIKLSLLNDCFDYIQARWSIVTMCQHAELASRSSTLPCIEWRSPSRTSH